MYAFLCGHSMLLIWIGCCTCGKYMEKVPGPSLKLQPCFGTMWFSLPPTGKCSMLSDAMGCQWGTPCASVKQQHILSMDPYRCRNTCDLHALLHMFEPSLRACSHWNAVQVRRVLWAFASLHVNTLPLRDACDCKPNTTRNVSEVTILLRSPVQCSLVHCDLQK